jgi:phosphate transport system permease protein
MASVRLKRRSTFGINSKIWDRVGNIGVIAMATIVVLTLAIIFIFVGSQSFQTFTISHISAGTFFLSKDWEFSNGTLVLTVGSLSLVVLGLAIAVPLSVGIALFITEIAPPWMGRTLRGIVELFLGIPSVIFGLLGVFIVIPIVKNNINTIAGDKYFTTGDGIFSAAIVVSFMVLPTITTIAVDSLAALPGELREGSLALGATRWQTITTTLVPAATPGIMTGVILGAARIIGETIAVALVIGGSPQIFGVDFLKNGKFFIGTTSVMTTEIFRDFSNNSSGATYNALWTLTFLLLVISALLILASRAVTSRSAYK